MTDLLLDVTDLKRHYSSFRLPGGRRVLRAVDGVSLQLRRGETLGIVGESGCGKSTLARCLLRLSPITAGSVVFDGTDISRASQHGLRKLRRRMQMVFQDSHASLNPRRRVGDLIAEPLRVHDLAQGAALRARLRELAAMTEISLDLLGRFPHELSGGQRQRVGIARALACAPELLVADEPVSALDVSVQARIVNLLMDLQERLNLACVLVSHDLRVVRQMTRRVAVMYLGIIVETGATEDVLRAPAHPYSAALLGAVPSVDPAARGAAASRLLPGEIPSAAAIPPGCRFHPRCRFADARCAKDIPALRRLKDGRMVACHYPLTAEP